MNQYRSKEVQGRRYTDFVKKYMEDITEEFSKIPNDVGCAQTALGLLLTDFNKNTKGCFNALWDSVDDMPYGAFSTKVNNDIRGNMRFITNHAPDKCVGYYLEKFGSIIYEDMKIDVMDYASR